MTSTNRRLLYLVFIAAALALSGTALVYANPWWLSGIMTVSIACWLAGLLLAIYTPHPQRATAAGALACSFLYVLLATGPWFETHVGSWLLTTRGLVAIDEHVLGHQQQPQGVYQVPTVTNWGYTTTINGIYTMSPTPSLWTTPQTPAPSSFVAIGHWLFAWFSAAIGGFVARRIACRRKPASSVVAEAAR